ncbi:hypothetical protein QCE49_32440 [Caballeronia sp. LZ008]|uniref:hypothetical protein n=1 Tax=Caballeronia sp. INML5 TaxID=2921750 RepID=UPI0020294619|nr:MULTISPECIES: hypothetical protein [unclassified Caballeronia]MDR5798109.1 hypothetical protein [Caballeronia sp. LZ008]
MCIYGSGLPVRNSIKKKLTERLVTLARDLRLDDPMHPKTNVGTIAMPLRPSRRRAQSIATASIGDGFQASPSSSRSMFAAGAGIIHRF